MASEDYELLKKYFLDKEKENIRLKEELETFKSKSNLNNQNNTDSQSCCNPKLNLTTNCADNSELPFNSQAADTMNNSCFDYFSNNRRFFKRNSLGFSTVKKDCEGETPENERQDVQVEGHRRIKSGIPSASHSSTGGDNLDCNFISQVETPAKVNCTQTSYNNGKKDMCLEMGRLYEEKSKSSNNLLSLNKGVIRNIGQNIGQLKSQLNNYEKAYESINNRLESSKQDSDLSTKEGLKKRNQELVDMVAAKEQAIIKLKEAHAEELKLKSEIYNENIAHLNKTHQEEIKRLRLSYEDKADQMVKKSEEEKIQLMEKYSRAKKQLSTSQSTDKNEMVEFQRRYLEEMKYLQKAFEDFRTKTYEEFRQLRHQREEAQHQSTFYKDHYERLRQELEEEDYHNKKELLADNDYLKQQLESSQAEVRYLKKKVVNKLEKKPKVNIKVEREATYLRDNDINSQRHVFSNKSSDLVNLENSGFTNCRSEVESLFSPPNYASKRSTEQEVDLEYQPKNKQYNPKYNTDSLESKLYKVIDLKKAHNKIKEMEECLKSMNEENESLRGQLGCSVSNITTPSNRRDTYWQKPDNNHSKLIEDNTLFHAQKSKKRDLTPQMISSRDPGRNTNALCVKRSNKVLYGNLSTGPQPGGVSGSVKAESENNDTNEDNIIEFPLQLKIKGKIKKISTNSSSKKK